MKKLSSAIKTSRQDIIEASFTRKLGALVKAKDQLVSDTAELSQRMIHFASSLADLEKEAKKLDVAYKTKIHTEEFEKHLSIKALRLSPAIRSRWNTIASEAQTLLKFHSSLPPTRDALYETARAIKQDENVSMWVKKNQITPFSTVQDINSLRSKGKRTAPLKKAPAKSTASTARRTWQPSNKRIPLGISIKDLPTDKPELAFHNDLMLLVVRREVDPDTSKTKLVAIGVLNDHSVLENN
jgi:hypothetical protein